MNPSQFPLKFPFTFSTVWPTSPEPSLQEDLLYNADPQRQAEAADRIAEAKDQYSKEWIVTVYDYLWRKVGEFGDDMMEVVGGDPTNDVPTATLKIKGTSEYVSHMMTCEKTLVGVTVETAGLRWAYYVDTFDWEFSEGEWVGTAALVGIWDILNFMYVWPNFLLPLQIQAPSHAIFFSPLCTAVEVMVSQCAFRIQLGINEFLNNALSLNLDIRTWFGTLLQSNGNVFDMLKTPVYVVRTNPFLDGSPAVVRTVRMESCGAVIRDITRPYGVDVRVDLWLPGDAQPDRWANLSRPTYVMTCKDRSQIEGPTKTILDSVIRQSVDVAGSFFGDISPIVETVPGMNGVFFSPALGVNYVPPWAVLIAPDPGQDGSIETCKISFHTPKGWQHIIGGRSPKWLNDLMNAFYAWIIDSVSILIGITGIPSNLLDGFLNNMILAFQLVQHYGRRNAVGPYHPCIEVVHATVSAPYNIETAFAFINALYDSRGYVSAQVLFRDGVVYKYGKDLFRGGLVSLLYMGNGRLFTDHITNVMFRLTPDARDVMLTIGDGKADESPLSKHQRNLTSLFESVNALTFAPQT